MARRALSKGDPNDAASWTSMAPRRIRPSTTRPHVLFFSCLGQGEKPHRRPEVAQRLRRKAPPAAMRHPMREARRESKRARGYRHGTEPSNPESAIAATIREGGRSTNAAQAGTPPHNKPAPCQQHWATRPPPTKHARAKAQRPTLRSRYARRSLGGRRMLPPSTTGHQEVIPYYAEAPTMRSNSTAKRCHPMIDDDGWLRAALRPLNPRTSPHSEDAQEPRSVGQTTLADERPQPPMLSANAGANCVLDRAVPSLYPQSGTCSTSN